MTTTGRLQLVALDAADIEALSTFYAALTGWEIARKESDWITLTSGTDLEIAFQLAPDHIPPQWPGQERPQQFHLDFQIDDHAVAAERAVGLGATRLAEGPSWITLADPAGHPFDLCQKGGIGPKPALFAVTIDTPRPTELARFYADLMGMEVTYDGPEGALITGAGKSVMFQRIAEIAEYTAPQWPDPTKPQQAHLDIEVDDLGAGGERARELGAQLLDDSSEGFWVFADPDGHPFCLVD